MKYSVFFSILSLFVGLFAMGCKEEPICDDPSDFMCPNYDRCIGKVAANSDFVVVSSFSFGADTIVELEADTLYGGPNSYYKALVTEGLASYEWQIGSDARRFRDSTVSLDFTGYEGPVRITLTTHAIEDRIQCLEESELMDVKTKEVYYVSVNRVGSNVGTFVGAVSDSDEEVTISIIGWTGSLETSFLLSGLTIPGNCGGLVGGVPLISAYQNFVSGYRNSSRYNRCRNLTVIGQIDKANRDKIQIDYWYDADDGSRKHEVFVGYRQ